MEHAKGLMIQTPDGGKTLITPEDLVDDIRDVEENGYLRIKLLGIEEVEQLTPEQLMRNVILPRLSIRVSGDTNTDPLLFDVECETFQTPEGFTYSPGTIGIYKITNSGASGHITDGGDIGWQTPGEGLVPTYSIRLNPIQGSVRSFGFYPRTTDEDYGISALEVDETCLRLVLAYRYYVEIIRQPSEETLPYLIAPHQF